MKATARATREERERPNVCLAVASAVSFAPRTVCRRGAVRGVCSGAACWFASGLHTPADAGSIPVPAILDARIRRAPTVARRGSKPWSPPARAAQAERGVSPGAAPAALFSRTVRPKRMDDDQTRQTLCDGVIRFRRAQRVLCGQRQHSKRNLRWTVCWGRTAGSPGDAQIMTSPYGISALAGRGRTWTAYGERPRPAGDRCGAATW